MRCDAQSYSAAPSSKSNPIDTDLALAPAPTARLPSSKDILVTPVEDLRSCVDYLRVLYIPEVRGSRRRRRRSEKKLKRTNASTSEIRTQDTNEDRIREIQNDAFERAHAIRWLISLVARGDDLITLACSESSSGPPDDDDGVKDGDGDGCEGEENEKAMRERLIEDASSLLAACAGTAGSGHISRTYTFGPSPRSGERAALTLTDAPLENGDYASVGAQTWGGACVMADMIFESPELFDLPGEREQKCFDAKREDRYRILELGAGTGLVGLAIAKLMQLRNVPADVVLTDFYPSVLANLRSNVAANTPSDAEDLVKVSVSFLDWSTYTSKSEPLSESENESENDIDLGTFDLIVGADIVYESSHAKWIKSCLTKLLRPHALAHFHLVIPLRHTHTIESSTVEQVFGEESSDDEFEIVYQERFSCDAHSDSDSRLIDRTGVEEVEYAYYKIGWKKKS